MMFPLLGGALAYVLSHPPAATDPEPAETVAEAPETPPPPAVEPVGEKVDFIVRRNDTLERIFRRLKLSPDDLNAILGLPGVRQALNRIRPGDKVTVVHEDGAVHALNRRISDTEVLAVTRGDDGFAAEILATPIEIKVAHAYGTIESSLFVAARAAGVSPETILQLANDIFGWQIDFALDIRPGDRFHLIYEQKHRDGQYIGDARILAAEFVNDGETHRAVYYASEDGKIDGYFAPDGRSMRLQFLRAPLDFRRVSSNFNPRRRHPILNRIRAHQGVDYSASHGTVIKAAGDGRVGFVGRKGGYGKVMILEHGGGISTLYAHMSGFARGMRPGQRVKQGQTIGYVGSTGAATGPHLHYEYRVNGIHKNPRTVRLPDAAPIPAAYRADFQAKAGLILADLEQVQETTLAAAPAD
ncbi:peptidase M23 [Sulfurifustis variabilis]|uniref:Peptidase M23 n=1 Tax=Sulfurifustis variabilis TaxID=1675686 RepID=A0A1B4V6D6_9GAMM|nr:peptidoglycan DD-metalloendopeptidase family protein [Sulfurifustis variabilis]BAU49123.1 peptidase M23 [Sulfurifustis variabilis]